MCKGLLEALASLCVPVGAEVAPEEDVEPLVTAVPGAEYASE